MKKLAPATLEPIACTLVQFRTILYPCSRASANVLVQSGELESFVHNGRRMVLLEKAREFLARKAAAGGKVSPAESAQKAAAGRTGRAVQLGGIA
jgi:hypothetical protein